MPSARRSGCSISSPTPTARCGFRLCRAFTVICPGPAGAFLRTFGGAFARLDYNLGSCLDADGTLFLGGINGITWFDPRQVERPDEAAKVYVSGVSVLNRNIVPDGVHLESNINRSHR